MQLMRRGVFFCLILAALPARGVAQDWGQPWSDPRDRPPRLDLSVTTGYAVPTDWSDLVILGSLSSATGALEQVIVRDLRVEPDLVLGAAVTYWRDRYGFRTQVSMSRSTLTVGGALDAAEAGGPRERVAADVDTWSYEVRGTIGLVEYTPDRKALPYVFLGLGGVTYDLSTTVTPPLLTFIQNPAIRRNGNGGIVIVEEDGSQFLVAVDELSMETQLAFSFGAGVDFRIPFGGGGMGVRLEVSDHLSESPLTVRITEMNPGGAFASDSAIRFGAVHDLRVTAGVVFQIGR